MWCLYVIDQNIDKSVSFEDPNLGLCGLDRVYSYSCLDENDVIACSSNQEVNDEK